MIARAWSASVACAVTAVLGCAQLRPGEEIAWFAPTGGKGAGPALRVHWTADLAPEHGGLYRPVERATPAVDRDHRRVFVGSTRNELLALTAEGKRLYRYATSASIEAEPALDADRDELYVTTTRGSVHALRASDGALRWKAETAASFSRPGVLSADALYLVSDDDLVVALGRADGAVLWRYKREPRAGLQIAGHAGLLVSGARLITGFTDGSVVALSASDGRVVWLLDTTLDVVDPAVIEKGFVDVDTTPVEAGGVVWVASFLSGLYGLDTATGDVKHRDAELTSITSLAAHDDTLLVASADAGVVCLDLLDMAPRWRREIHGGAPGTVQVDNHTVYVTETRGALLAFELASGREVGRLQSEHGFTASPKLLSGRGFLLGNTGRLYAFTY